MAETFDFYITLGQIQDELDLYYQKHGTCLAPVDAIERLSRRGEFETELHNYKILPSLYHLDKEAFIQGIRKIQVEANAGKIYQMKKDISHFQSDRIDVFIQNSFHHEVCAEHCHANFEVDYIYNGSYDFFFQSESRRLVEGDVIFISPGAVHRIVEASEDAFMVSFYVNFATLSTAFLSLLERSNFLADFFKEVLANQTAPNYLFLSTGPRKNLADLVQNIFLEQHKYDEYSPACSLSWLKIFFGYVMRQYHEFHQYADCGVRMDFGPILDYINKHYKTANLSEIAAHFGYSTAYLSTVIHKVTGKTYSQIIRQQRLSDARELLERTDHTVSEIAQLSGYNDTDHFSKTFKSAYGLSPQQYRKSLKRS